MTDHPNGEGQEMPFLARLLSFVDKPHNVTRLFYLLLVICIALGLSDFLYHKHAYFAVEEFPAIYGIFGFIVYAAVIFLAKGLRLIVRRPEDYYEPLAIDTEDERAAGSAPEAKGGRPHA
ncbi:MAG: hypothetical protein CVT73_23690 [Alphaproteobacteria bacterium HGW-Alphaproteobacteria-12]|nr:MAG: hypothetical protein CVT73_23690 [Alphaproteobacteria bacterium HGW-Alphaproteobacteria-12]